MGATSSTHNLYFEQIYEKISECLSENLAKFSIILDRRVFVMFAQIFYFSTLAHHFTINSTELKL